MLHIMKLSEDDLFPEIRAAALLESQWFNELCLLVIQNAQVAINEDEETGSCNTKVISC